MKMFTKLALVSSMAVSANAMAMQSMDDAALSAATGQDGINIGIGISKIEIEKVLIHDNDGLDYTKKQWVGSVNAKTEVTPVAPGSESAYVPQQGNGDGTPGNAAAVLGKSSLGYGGTAEAGAIVIKGDGKSGSKTQSKGIVIEAPVNAAGNGFDTDRKLASGLLAEIAIDTDAGQALGDDAGNTAFLNVAAKVSGLDIYIGEIGVSGSKASPTTGATSIRRGANDTAYNSSTNASGNYGKILSGLTLKTGKMDANIQLGAAPQGAMIVLNTSMVGGLEIKDLGIIDSSTLGKTVAVVSGNPVNTTTEGEIRLDSIKVADANGTDLTVNAKVSVYGKSAVNNGFLKIVTGSGASTPATDVYIAGVHLGSKTVVTTAPGSTTSIGDIEVQGLQTYYNNGSGFSSTGANDVKGATITISGH